MTFLWPHMLWLIWLVPLLGLLYFVLLRRRRRASMRYAHLGLVWAALNAAPAWRRYVPPALFLAAFLGMTLSVARPAAYLTLPEARGIVILAVDASGSMLEADIFPNRLIAAQNAMRSFISEQPPNVHIGLVAFSANAWVLQAPTLDREALSAAVDRIVTSPATAIGSGILTSLSAIFEATEDPLQLSPDIDVAMFWGGDMLGAALGSRAPVEPGSRQSAAIVVLSDGASNRGLHPLLAAELAAALGVRVYTVGLGDPAYAATSINMRLDEPTLRGVAELTGAEYFPAGTESELHAVYRELGADLVLISEPTEVTALFSALSGVLAFFGGLFSLLWFNRLF